jgi:transposase
MEAHKKENCSFRGTTLPQSKISEIKKLYHFGLNFSDVSKQTGISRKTISKYISGDISNTKMRQPNRDIVTEVVLTYTEFFKYTKPSITCSGIRKKLLENDICNPQNVPSEKYLSQACVHELGLSYKKLDKIHMESQRDDVQMRFDDFTTFISNKDPNKFHFFDESSVVRTTGNRNYGSSAKGSRAFELQRYASNANYTINLLLSRFGVDYFNVIDPIAWN